jgi:hypothetical protein
MERREQVENFGNQVEQSLDMRIAELRELDEAKSQALDSLKRQILREVDSGEGGGQLGSDLNLTLPDWVEMYNSLQVSNSVLFEELSLASTGDFMRFLGVEEGTPYTSFTGDDLKLFGESVNLTMPFGANEFVLQNYQQAFANIENCEQLRGLVDASTDFVAKDFVRVEFSVTAKEGEKIDYLATPEGVFRLVDDTVPDQREFVDLSNDTKMIETKGAAYKPRSFELYFYNADGALAGDVTYGPQFKEMQRTFDEDGELVEYREFVEGKLTEVNYNDFSGQGLVVEKYYMEELFSVKKRDEQVFYGEGGVESYGVNYAEDGVPKHKFLFTDDGESFGTYDYMLEIHPDMTESEYIAFLAEHLNTPEKLVLFFEHLMQYVYDSYDEKDKIVDGAKAENVSEGLNHVAEYWQTAHETVGRVKDGCMLGDCDDYAFLAKEILRLQGETAYVVSLPRHATCVWFDQGPNGNWNAYSIGTFGFDKNGNRLGMEVDEEKEKGYSTLEEALNSLMPKFDNGGLGLEDGSEGYRLSDGKIELLDVPRTGEREYIYEVPIGLLADPQMVEVWQSTTHLSG